MRDHWYPNGSMSEPYLPVKVSDSAMVFGGGSGINDLLPPANDIPDAFCTDYNTESAKWRDFQRDWHFGGLANVNIDVKDGIDLNDAMRHLRTIQGSYGLKHEYKEAAVAYLASLWFNDVQYEIANRPQPA